MPLLVDWDEADAEWRSLRNKEEHPKSWGHYGFTAEKFVSCWRFWQWVRVACQHCGKQQDVTIVQDKPVLDDACCACKQPAEDPVWYEAVLGAVRQGKYQGVKTLLGGHYT